MSTDDTSNTGHDAKINTRNHLCLIDDEAEVSGEESSSEYGFRGEDTAPGAFPKFMQLPPELRYQIWHFYCPDLIVKARVLPFMKWPGSTISDTQNDSSVSGHSALADQTRNLRTTLSTHRESRRIAMRKYKDELVMDAASGTSIVRFRKETDVILLKKLSTNVDYSVPGFGNTIQNLAVETVEDSEGQHEEEDLLLKALPALKGLFPNLKRLFSYELTQTWLPSRGEWYALECVQWYMVKTDCGREPGLGDHTNILYCWPDLDTYPDLVKSSVPNICSFQTMDKAGVEFWPIVGFGSEISMEVYDMMRRQYWPSSANCDDSSDSDEYDSEAIDHDNDVIDHDEVVELLASSEVELSPGEIGVFSSLSSEIG